MDMMQTPKYEFATKEICLGKGRMVRLRFFEDALIFERSDGLTVSELEAAAMGKAWKILEEVVIPYRQVKVFESIDRSRSVTFWLEGGFISRKGSAETDIRKIVIQMDKMGNKIDFDAVRRTYSPLRTNFERRQEACERFKEKIAAAAVKGTVRIRMHSKFNWFIKVDGNVLLEAQKPQLDAQLQLPYGTYLISTGCLGSPGADGYTDPPSESRKLQITLDEAHTQVDLRSKRSWQGAPKLKIWR